MVIKSSNSYSTKPSDERSSSTLKCKKRKDGKEQERVLLSNSKHVLKTRKRNGVEHKGKHRKLDSRIDFYKIKAVVEKEALGQHRTYDDQDIQVDKENHCSNAGRHDADSKATVITERNITRANPKLR